MTTTKAKVIEEVAIEMTTTLIATTTMMTITVASATDQIGIIIKALVPARGML